MNKMETNTNNQDGRRPYIDGGRDVSQLASPYNVFGVGQPFGIYRSLLDKGACQLINKPKDSSSPDDYLPVHPLIFVLKTALAERQRKEREELRQILAECDTVDNMLEKRKLNKPQGGAWTID